MTEGNERNCKNCKNYVPLPDKPEIRSCRKWDCEYEPRGTMSGQDMGDPEDGRL